MASIVAVVALGGGFLLSQSRQKPSVASTIPTPSTITSTSSPSTPASGKTTVVWFIGLGAGGLGTAFNAEVDFVNHYNATNLDNIVLQLDIPPAGPAGYTIADQLVGTDIVGPMPVEARAQYAGYWRGLNDEIDKNGTDLNVYPPVLLKTFLGAAGQYIGLPYDEYPAFIFYNKDLFKAAGLPDLPTQVGEKYMGADWTWDELATIAKRLTVDTSGRSSTDPRFDPGTIKDYGFDMQYVEDLRRLGTAWGAGSYVAADGKTAQIPPVWEQAWKWYYDAMWTSHFAPTGAERAAAGMGSGSTIATGRVAMGLTWAWAVSSFGPLDASGNPTPASAYKHWDMGVLPSNDGVTTDPIDTDTFALNKETKVADAAYKAMLAIMADPKLRVAYGGMPVAQSMQASYFRTAQASVDKQFVDNPVTWSVLAEMTKYAASPTHQDPLPSYVKASQDDQDFFARLRNTSGLDLDAEVAKLKLALQADFNAPQ